MHVNFFGLCGNIYYCSSKRNHCSLKKQQSYHPLMDAIKIGWQFIQFSSTFSTKIILVVIIIESATTTLINYYYSQICNSSDM